MLDFTGNSVVGMKLAKSEQNRDVFFVNVKFRIWSLVGVLKFLPHINKSDSITILQDRVVIIAAVCFAAAATEGSGFGKHPKRL